MLKVAQQLATAECRLQEHEQQLWSSSADLLELQQQQQQQQPQQQDAGESAASKLQHDVQKLEQQVQDARDSACSAAADLASPSTALLQLCREFEQRGFEDGRVASGLWVQDKQTYALFKQCFEVLLQQKALQEDSRMVMAASLSGQVSLQSGLLHLHARLLHVALL
jgi:seryl-tRNA synthetase